MRLYKWIRQPNDQRVVMSSLGGDEVIAKFRCDNCGTWIYTKAIEIPEPNMAGENNRESEVIIESEAYCTNEECAKTFNIHVSNSFGGSDFEIEDIQWTDIFFKYYDEELERIFSATDFYGLFEESLAAINSMADIKIDDGHRKILNRMLLSHSVTAMESYLLNALTILTLQTEERIANALQSIDRFNYRKYTDEIISGDKDAIISAILNSLRDESFHNLKKVKRYYEKILNVEIDFDTSMLGKIIQLRHDILHRNGKSKDGEEINIDNEDLAEKVSEVVKFIEHVNEKLLEIYVT